VNLVLTNSTGTVVDTGHHTGTVTDGPNGKYVYSVQSTEFANAGEYTGKVRITYSGDGFEELYETFLIEVR
jgi:hypothetical protein